MRRLHGANDARAHLDALDRLEPAGELTVATETGVAATAAGGLFASALLLRRMK
jgi:hypothetical protein